MKPGRCYRWVVLSGMFVASAANCAATSIENDPGAVVRKLFDAFNRHDMATLSQLYASDAEITSPDHPQSLHGPKGVRAIYTPLFTTFPNISDRLVSMTVQDNRVAVEFVSSGCKAAGNDCFTLPIVRDASYFNVAAPSCSAGHFPYGHTGGVTSCSVPLRWH